MQEAGKIISRTKQALMAQGGIAITHGYYLMRLKSLTGMPVFGPHFLSLSRNEGHVFKSRWIQFGIGKREGSGVTLGHWEM